MIRPSWPSAAGLEVPETAAPERERGAEDHLPVVLDVVQEIDLAHDPLERGEEEGQRLLVVPDVGAVERAAAALVVAALEAEEVPALEPEAGRRPDDRRLAGERRRGRRAAGSSAKKTSWKARLSFSRRARFAWRYSAAAQASAKPLGVVVLEDAAALLGDDVEIVEEVGEVPGQDEGQGRPRRTGRSSAMSAERARRRSACRARAISRPGP